jgi:hypothetical protein
MCSSALGDGPGKVTSPSTFAQGKNWRFIVDVVPLAAFRG